MSRTRKSMVTYRISTSIFFGKNKDKFFLRSYEAKINVYLIKLYVNYRKNSTLAYYKTERSLKSFIISSAMRSSFLFAILYKVFRYHVLMGRLAEVQHGLHMNTILCRVCALRGLRYRTLKMSYWVPAR